MNNQEMAASELSCHCSVATPDQSKSPAPSLSSSANRLCAEAFMRACIERLGGQSPAALMACDTYLSRDMWESYMKPRSHSLWILGRNAKGQLGIGTREHERLELREVATFSGRQMRTVAFGLEHTMFLTDDGELWAAGDNTYGLLGAHETRPWWHVNVPMCGYTGKSRVYTMPIRISTFPVAGLRVTAVACGHRHTLAIVHTGVVYTWGDNSHAQLGLGAGASNKVEPVGIPAFTADDPATTIGCGALSSFAITASGKLYSRGRCDPTLGLDYGELRCVAAPTAVECPDNPNVKFVCASKGPTHMAAVTTTGAVYTWGANDYGQLGIGVRSAPCRRPQLAITVGTMRAVQVACGRLLTVMVFADGAVYACGISPLATFGLPGETTDIMPYITRINAFHGKAVADLTVSCERWVAAKLGLYLCGGGGTPLSFPSLAMGFLWSHCG